MRAIRVAAPLALCVLVFARSSAAEIPVYQITAELQNGRERVGTGFAVSDWRDRNRVLLLTALHVVHDAVQIRIRAVDCLASGTNRFRELDDPLRSGEVLVWKTYDLAFIPVTPAMRVLSEDIRARGGPGVLKLEADAPESGSPVAIPGVSQNSACLSGGGIVAGSVSVRLHSQDVAARLHTTDQAVRAGMDPEGIWLQYTDVQATEGSSGAPVTQPGSRVVLGIHLQCYPGSAVCWGLALRRNDRPGQARGIRLAGQDAVNGDRAQIGRWWPEVSWPARRLQTAAFTVPRSDAPELARRWWYELRSGWSFLLLTEHALATWTDDSPWAFGASWRVEWEDALGRSRQRALGFQLGFGPRLELTRQRLESPGGDAMGSRALKRWGALLEPVGELRMLRFASVRPTLSFGPRLGLVAFDEPDGDVAVGVAWGLVFRLRVLGALTRRHGMIVDIGAALERSPSMRYQYAVSGGHMARDPAEWDLLLSMGIGYGS